MEATLKNEGILEGEVHIQVMSDAEIQSLNLQFRGLDEPTDVLTFPAPSGPGWDFGGDVAISLEMARSQAASRGVSVKNEIQLLTIHGGLHLAGYDDEEAEDQATMVAKMNEVAAQLGIPGDANWWSHHYGR